MPASKIVNEDEVIRWFADGKTYAEMSEIYRTKYNIETVPSLWGNFRRRRGLDRRITRDDELIPWHVLPKHRWRYPVKMLRFEARRRAGFELGDAETKELESWLAFLDEQKVVAHYEPDLEDGFVYVPRERTDKDIIRKPAVKTTLRAAAD